MISFTPAHKAIERPPGQVVDGWIRVDNRLPLHGTYIEGRNEKGQTWFESFDNDEPIGRMTHWRKA